MSYTQASTVTATPPQDHHIARSWDRQRSAESTKVQTVEDFDFMDLIDLVNPLHHIPVVGTAYREMTGDTIKPSMQVAGDLIFGAVTGSVLLSGVASIATIMYEQQHGEAPITQLAGSLFNDDIIQEASPEAGNIYLADQGFIGAEPEEKLDLAEAVVLPNLEAETVVSVVAEPVAEQAAELAEAEAENVDSQTLGQIMHEQATVQKAGLGLPPELVRDMMIMAMDKYKTAAKTTSGSNTVQ